MQRGLNVFVSDYYILYSSIPLILLIKVFVVKIVKFTSGNKCKVIYTITYFYSTPLSLPKTFYIRKKYYVLYIKLKWVRNFEDTKQLLLPHTSCHQVQSLPSSPHPAAAPLHDHLVCLSLTWPVIDSPHTTQECSEIQTWQITAPVLKILQLFLTEGYKYNYPVRYKGFLWPSLHTSPPAALPEALNPMHPQSIPYDSALLSYLVPPKHARVMPTLSQEASQLENTCLSVNMSSSMSRWTKESFTFPSPQNQNLGIPWPLPTLHCPHMPSLPDCQQFQARKEHCLTIFAVPVHSTVPTLQDVLNKCLFA